jgi:hypothetical protein
VDGLDGDDPLEWNAYADPSAVAAVFETEVPIDLIPLDATDDVPVPADLPMRLADDRAAAGADLVYELLSRHPGRLAADQGQQLWDELAALTVTRPGLVTWADGTLVVGDDGRLTPDGAGRAVRFAAAADRAAVEAALLEALRRGGPRATPFSTAGTIDITWDGTVCAATVDPPGEVQPGSYELRYTGPSSGPSGGLLVALDEGRPWSDLRTFLSGLDPEGADNVQPPEWTRLAGQVVDEAGNGATVVGTATVTEAATHGPICASGGWPDLTFVPGEPLGD